MEVIVTIIDIALSGLADIMFDRFFDHSKEVRPPDQKLYLREAPSGDNELVFPAGNIHAFLFNDKPPGCAKMFEGRQSRQYMSWGGGHIFLEPPLIPILADNKKVCFKGFNEQIYVYSSSPRTNGIKQPEIHRPVLKLPWEMKFKIRLIKNPKIDSPKLRNWFDMGGLQMGLGNHRPLYGRFMVTKWEIESREI